MTCLWFSYLLYCGWLWDRSTICSGLKLMYTALLVPTHPPLACQINFPQRPPSLWWTSILVLCLWREQRCIVSLKKKCEGGIRSSAIQKMLSNTSVRHVWCIFSPSACCLTCAYMCIYHKHERKTGCQSQIKLKFPMQSECATTTMSESIPASSGMKPRSFTIRRIHWKLKNAAAALPNIMVTGPVFWLEPHSLFILLAVRMLSENHGSNSLTLGGWFISAIRELALEIVLRQRSCVCLTVSFLCVCSCFENYQGVCAKCQT